MSGLIETLWQQFSVEAFEHCDAIDRLLASSAQAGANEDGDTAARIAALFRAFHSLKGGARAMDLFGPESLAHRAETLLGLIRSGQLPLDETNQDILLDALDGLRSLIELALADRLDKPAPEQLIARLDQAASSHPAAAGQSAGDQSAIATQPNSTLPHASLPHASLPHSSLPHASPRKGTLHSNERRLEIYVTLMRNGMVTLTRALGGDQPDDGGLADILDTAEQLQTASERLEFGPCAEIYQSFGNAVRNSDTDGILDSLRLLVPAARRLGRITGNDTGADILATLLADHNLGAIASDGGHLLGLLTGSDGGKAPFPAIGKAFLKLATGLELAGLDHSTGLARRAAEVFCGLTDLPTKDQPAKDQPTKKMRDDLAAILTELLGAIAADPSKDASPAQVAAVDRILDRFIQLQQQGDSPDITPFTAEELVANRLSPDLLRFLSPDTTRQLHNAIRDENSHLYIIAARLEEDQELASSFMQWLGRAVEPITNWPDFSAGPPTLKLLIASQMDRAALAASLAEMNPDGQLLVLCEDQDDPPTSPSPPSSAKAANPAAPAPAGNIAGGSNSGGSRATGQAAGAPTKGESGDGHLRVAGAALDRMLERVDGMVRLSGALHMASKDRGPEQILASLAIRLGPEDRNLKRLAELLERHRRELADLDQQFSDAIDRLRGATLDLRVVPVAVLMTSFPRLIREMARAQAKQIRLAVEGDEVKVDKSTVEALRDPLLHMVRNAVDHGIEPADERVRIGKPAQATLTIRARQSANQVTIEIAEDGRGIISDKIRERIVANGLLTAEAAASLADDEINKFIFAPGFSTAATITETSGRGVGMDVARNAITRLGGAIDIETSAGKGTLFRVSLPLTAAVSRCLLIECGDQILAIPDRHVGEVLTITADGLDENMTVAQDAHRIPALPLAEALGYPSSLTWPPLPGTHLFAVALRYDGGMIAMAVDRLLKRTDLFIRESHPGLAALPGIGGVSMLNDGKVVVILDGEALCHMALSMLPARQNPTDHAPEYRSPTAI